MQWGLANSKNALVLYYHAYQVPGLLSLFIHFYWYKK